LGRGGTGPYLPYSFTVVSFRFWYTSITKPVSNVASALSSAPGVEVDAPTRWAVAEMPARAQAAPMARNATPRTALCEARACTSSASTSTSIFKGVRSPPWGDPPWGEASAPSMLPYSSTGAIAARAQYPGRTPPLRREGRTVGPRRGAVDYVGQAKYT